jgi:acylphosphatase
MSKLKITIIGENVHDVGYRPFLLDEADSQFIPNFFAKNIKRDGKEVLEVLVEGDTEKIEIFKAFVSNNFPESAKVDDVSFSDYGGLVMDVESYNSHLKASLLSKIASTWAKMAGV